MSWKARLRNWKRQLFDRAGLENELDAEIQAYTDHLQDEYVRQGMPTGEAARAAKREIGSAALLKDQCRDVRTFHWWDDLRRDLRFGLRQIARNPLLSTAIVLTLALGIGANVVVFSVVRAVVFRPLAYRQPERLVQISQARLRTGTEADWISIPDFWDWNRQNRVFQGMAAYRYQLFALTGEQGPESIVGLEITDGLFSVLGVPAMIGRALAPGDGESAAVIGYALWQRRFGGDPAIAGRHVTIDGRPSVVVGVMPPSFRFPYSIPSETLVAGLEIWVPMRPGSAVEDRGNRNYWAVGRLRDAVTIEQARAEMDGIAANLARAYPENNRNIGVKLRFMQDHLSRGARPALLMLLGSVGMLLLLACLNIANLLLSRAEARRREMAIRLAIGAGRGRLFRQAITESLLIASIGASAGLALASFATSLILRLAPVNVPRIHQTSIDAQVLIFTCFVTVATGILFGLMPALAVRPGSAYRSIKEAAVRASSRRAAVVLRHALIGAQMALAVVLLTTAGLLIRSFVNVVRLDLGFRPDRVVIGFVSLTQSQYADPARRAAFFETALARIRALPGVESAGVSSAAPLTGINEQGTLAIEGHTPRPGEPSPRANRPSVSTGYFETMGISSIAGRLFEPRDNASGPYVAIVSEFAARTWWPGENAIGKRIGVNSVKGQRVWREVVGVVGSTRHFGIEQPIQPEVYLPHTQRPSDLMILVVRARKDPQGIIRDCQRELAAVDPNQPGFGFAPMDDLLANGQSRRRFQSWLLATFAGLAVFLAALGLYGVIAYSVAQRTREIGTRIALGASGRTIVAMVMKQGLWVTLVGTAAGLIGAVALSRVLSGLLFGVSALDLPTFGGVVVVLVSVAVLSTWLPSRRAARMDPLIALREE